MEYTVYVSPIAHSTPLLFLPHLPPDCVSTNSSADRNQWPDLYEQGWFNAICSAELPPGIEAPEWGGNVMRDIYPIFCVSKLWTGQGLSAQGSQKCSAYMISLLLYDWLSIDPVMQHLANCTHPLRTRNVTPPPTPPIHKTAYIKCLVTVFFHLFRWVIYLVWYLNNWWLDAVQSK